MKYTVQIKYTNPSHEHVSLRRRVDSITRLVEATSQQEAINRAANQQRALGFIIREAAVMNDHPKEENMHADSNAKKKKKIVGDDHDETEIGASGGVKKEEVEQTDESRIAGVLSAMADVDKKRRTSFPRSGGVINYNPKTEKSEKDGTANVYDPKKHDQKLSPKGGFTKMKKEEVERTDEALLPKQKAVADRLKSAELAANKEKAGHKYGKSLRANKVRKAAEKMVNKAKGKANKINMTPEIEPGKPNA